MVSHYILIFSVFSDPLTDHPLCKPVFIPGDVREVFLNISIPVQTLEKLQTEL